LKYAALDESPSLNRRVFDGTHLKMASVYRPTEPFHVKRLAVIFIVSPKASIGISNGCASREALIGAVGGALRC
jgi:hypothetical protein